MDKNILKKLAYEGERGADLTLREVWKLLDAPWDLSKYENLREPVKEFWRSHQDEYEGNLRDIAQAFIDQMNKISSEIKVDFAAIINRDHAWDEGQEAGHTWCQKNDAPVDVMLKDIPQPPKDFPKEFAEAYIEGAKAAWEADFGPLSWSEQARTVLVDEKGNASITEAIVGEIWGSGWDARLHDHLNNLEEGKYLVEFLGADSGGSDAIKDVKINKISTSRTLISSLKKLSAELTKEASKRLETMILIGDVGEFKLTADVSYSSYPEQQTAELEIENIEISVPETGEIVHRYDTLEEAVDDHIVYESDASRIRELADDLLTYDPRVDYEMERRKERRHGLASKLKNLASKLVKVKSAAMIEHFETKTLAEIEGQEVEVDFSADVEFQEPGCAYQWHNMKIIAPSGEVIDLGNDPKAAWENWKVDVESMDDAHELFLEPY